MNTPEVRTNTPPDPKLLDQLRARLRLTHYSIRTEAQDVQSAGRSVLFHGKRDPREMDAGEVEAFLTRLAVDGPVAAATHNQAGLALLFLYHETPGIDQPWLDGVVWGKRPERLPAVFLRRQQAHQLLPLPGDQTQFAQSGRR